MSLESDLIVAAIDGDAKGVARFLAAGAKVDAKDARSGASALMLACAAGATEAVSELLAAGADPLAMDRDGYGPASFAARSPKCLSLLLAAGADIGERWGTPLRVALQHGALESIGILLDAGAAEPSKWSKEAASPLIVCAAGDRVDSARLLLERGFAPEGLWSEKLSEPLALGMARSWRLEMLELLLEWSADLDAKDAKGESLRSFALGNPGLSPSEMILAAIAREERSKLDEAAAPAAAPGKSRGFRM